MDEEYVSRLAQARFNLFEQAWTTRDVNALTALQSKETHFSDYLTSKWNLNYDALLKYNTKQCEDFSEFRFRNGKMFYATLIAAVYECEFDAVAAKDVPEARMKVGDVATVVGTFHFRYQWEGEGPQPSGGEVSDVAVQGWKIIEQKDIFAVVGDWTNRP